MAYNMSRSANMNSYADPDRMRNDYGPLAIARVAFQGQISQVYSPLDALKRGTLFPELDLPWLEKRGAYK